MFISMHIIHSKYHLYFHNGGCEILEQHLKCSVTADVQGIFITCFFERTLLKPCLFNIFLVILGFRKILCLVHYRNVLMMMMLLNLCCFYVILYHFSYVFINGKKLSPWQPKYQNDSCHLYCPVFRKLQLRLRSTRLKIGLFTWEALAKILLQIC